MVVGNIGNDNDEKKGSVEGYDCAFYLEITCIVLVFTYVYQFIQ